MTPVRIAPIVEGHGECAAVPILIRRIAQRIDPGLAPVILPPQRIPASRLIKENEIERSVVLAGRKLEGAGGILVLLDCDDGCPATDGPRLLTRAKSARSDIPISVVLAKREFEAWFLAASESLRGQHGLPLDLEAPPYPEEIRGAKEWISRLMPPGKAYTETGLQPKFTHSFDMDLARRADSFDKCFREIDGMLRQLLCMYGNT